MNGGSARHGAPGTTTILNGPDCSGGIGVTALQRAMQLLAAAYAVAVQECDERQQDAFFLIACDIAARHRSRQLQRESSAA